MSTRKEPAAIRDGAPPPLRRGRGLRLSTETARQEPQKTPAVARRKASAAQTELAAAADTAAQTATDQAAVYDPTSAVQKELAATADTTVSQAADLAQADVREPAAPDVIASVADVAPIAAAQAPERRKRELRLRKDLLKACKRIAKTQNRKLGQVIETALEEYIQRHGAPE